MTRTILPVLLLSLSFALRAGTNDTTIFRSLNARRIHTDICGMKVLATWGLLNTLGGIAGIAGADNDESRHFHEMNTIWGAINLGIAGLGYFGARRELSRNYSGAMALHRYEANKRLFLLNAGLDGLYIASGLLLKEHAKGHTHNPDLYRGFGNSLILQGAGLLLFDVTMFSLHQRQNSAWHRLMEGMAFTENGIRWRYAIR